MAADDKPKKAGLAIALLLGRPKGKPNMGAEAADDGEDDREQGITLTREFLDAVREAMSDGDPSDDKVEAVYDAFHALSMHCDALPHKEWPHEDDDEDDEAPASGKGY
jgi:hypothetical protein